MKNEKSFRKNVIGGFNTRDVVDYLAQMSKERREETEALRAGADRLRKERDDALAGKSARKAESKPAYTGERVAALERERDSLAATVETLRAELLSAREAAVLPEEGTAASELEKMRLRYYEMRKERDDLQARLDMALAERERERASEEQFHRERTAFENDRSSVLDALTRREEEKAELANERIAWLEERTKLINEQQNLIAEREGFCAKIEALGREIAELTEKAGEMSEMLERSGALREQLNQSVKEAEMRRENAEAQSESVRQETARLVSETRARFNEIIAGGKASSLEIVLELDRMRGFFARFSERFADIEQGIARLESDPRPHVRAFVPVIFEENGEQTEADGIE